MLKQIDDQILWPDWKERQIDLLDKAKFFDFVGRPSAAEWIEELAHRVATKNSSKMLMKYLDETLTAWGTDFAGNDLSRIRKVKAVSKTILSSISTGKLDKEIQTALRILRELRKNYDNLTPIGVAFMPYRRSGDRKMHFYGYVLLLPVVH